MYAQSHTTWQTAIHSLTTYTKRTITFTKLSIVSILFITASFIPLITFTSTAHADVSCSPDSVNLSGSSWLNGGGVNVCSADEGNTNVCVPVSGAPGDSHCSSGNVWSGTEWQCVELINRLYLSKGWTTATWSGNGDQLINDVPSGLTEQGNGSLSYINPGDVLTQTHDSDGHAAVVDTVVVSGGTTTVNIVNQNTTNPSDDRSYATITSGSFSSGNATLTMHAWSGYSVQAIIHRPASTSQGNRPVSISRSSSSMDLFYSDGNSHLVNKGWTASGGWTGPNVLLSSGVAGDPALAVRDSNEMQVFYRDTSGNLKSINWNSSSGWNTNPQNLYSTAASTDPAATSRSSDSMEVFFAKNNGNLVHLGWSSTYGWITQDWTANMSLTSKPTAIARNSGGDMSAYYKQSNGNVAEQAWDWQNGWSGQSWTASLAGSPSAIPGVSNVIDDFYRETGGNITDRFFTGSAWQTANVVGSGSATGDPYAIARGTTNEEVFYWNGTSLMDANWNTTSQSWSASRIN